MEIQQFFNGILLALSISTVILTLVSYVIYRIRQLPSRKNMGTENLKIHGLFFKRYVPAGFVLETNPVVMHPKKSGWFFWKNQSASVFYLVSFAVILGAILIQSYLLNTEFVSGRRINAKNYKELYEQGLLRTYEFSSRDTSRILEEAIPPLVLERTEGIIKQLERNHVVLFRNQLNLRATEYWANFLRTNRIPFQQTTELFTIGSANTVIFPQVRTLTKEQKLGLEALVKKGIGIVASGPIGVVREGENAESTTWTDAHFGVKFVRNPNKADFFPSVFAGGNISLWDVPPGMLLKLYPVDNEWLAIPTLGNSAAFESGYTGFFHETGSGSAASARTYITRMQWIKDGNSRRVWMAFDPGQEEKMSSQEKFYAKTAFLSTLAWAGKNPLSQLDLWPKGHAFSSVVAIDGLNGFENMDRFTKALKKTKTPATLFISPKHYLESGKYLRNIQEDFDLGLGYYNPLKSTDVSAEKYFEHIQVARFDLEEKARQPIQGFQPAEEKYDTDMVNAVWQNRFKYLMGDNRYSRLSPLWINSGKLLFIPRISPDDIQIERQRELENQEQVAKAIEKEFSRVKSVGGLFLLSLHTSVFGQKIYQSPLEKTLKTLSTEQPWKATLSELHNWWRTRELIETRVAVEKTNPQTFVLSVTNKSDNPAKDLSIHVDLGQENKISLVASRDIASTSEETPTIEEDRLKIALLNPRESKKFLIKGQP